MLVLLTLLAGGATVTLPEEALVRGAELELAAVATIEADDPGVLARLGAFELGYVPAPGYARVLSRPRIAAELRRAFPDLEQLVVAGAERCRVLPECTEIAADAILGAARDALAARFAGQQTSLRPTSTHESVLVPLGAQGVRLDAAPTAGGPRAGAWSVPVRIWVDDAPYRTIWTSWDVECWVERPVLLRDVARGEALSTADVELRRVRVDDTGAVEPLSSDTLRGVVARRDLRAGTALQPGDVERARVVRKGDLVHVEVHKGLVVARASALAAEDGRVGDRIRVTASATGRELVATVVSSDLVELRVD